jgi:hypothetical protein
LSSVGVHQPIPRIAGEELNVIGTALTKELEQLIEEPWRGYNGRSGVEGVSMKGEGSGAPSGVWTCLKNIDFVAKRP